MHVLLHSIKKIQMIPYEVSSLIILIYLKTTVLALIQQGISLVNFLTENRLFSLLFYHRRPENRRGAPIRAALTWTLLEECRVYAELRFNQNCRITARPLRLSVQNMIGESFYQKRP